MMLNLSPREAELLLQYVKCFEAEIYCGFDTECPINQKAEADIKEHQALIKKMEKMIDAG